MERINTDYKPWTWKISAKLFKMHKLWRNPFKTKGQKIYTGNITESLFLKKERKKN